jgi:hypothetical protein
MSKKFNQVCIENGILRQLTIPYTLQQNGVAKLGLYQMKIWLNPIPNRTVNWNVKMKRKEWIGECPSFDAQLEKGGQCKGSLILLILLNMGVLTHLNPQLSKKLWQMKMLINGN